MLRTVFTKTLWDQRRGLLGWCIGVAVLVVLEAALWPSIRGMADLEHFLDSYPPALRELFNLQDFASGRGFMNAELFSAVMPVLFIVFGIGRGARAVAGEEETGTLEVLLLTPVSATRLVLQQAAALVTSTVALGAVRWTTLVLASTVADLGIGAGEAAAGALAVTLLGTEFGCVALALGAATGRRAVAIAGAATAALAAYLLYGFGQLVDAVRPWQPLSPFHQALADGPLGGGVAPAFAWLALGAAVVIAAAMPVFERRDIAVH